MGYILWFIFDWGWAFWVSTGLWAFWWLPGAPFFAVAVAITLAIKKISETRQAKKAKKQQDEAESAEEQPKEATETDSSEEHNNT